MDDEEYVYFHEVLFGLMRKIFDLGDIKQEDNAIAYSYIDFKDY